MFSTSIMIFPFPSFLRLCNIFFWMTRRSSGFHFPVVVKTFMLIYFLFYAEIGASNLDVFFKNAISFLPFCVFDK